MTEQCEETTIPEFFKNRDIFLTGGSGFMGKCLMEKLLYSCSDLNRIILLIREKKGKTVDERLDDLKQDSVFERIRAERPELLNKLCAVSGDVSALDLGLSNESFTILENVSVIFHVAASVRFDDHLKLAVLMNTRGTRELIYVAKRLKNIRVVMHVSTTYCYPNQKVIEEKIHPTYANWRTTIKIAETLDEDAINCLALKYSKFQPNTYTFTKSLAEHVCNDFKDEVPLVIFRPSIVISSVAEPMPGWIDNFNGPIGLLVGCGVGINRTMYCRTNQVSDFTPCDVAIKAMIVAAWKRGIIKTSSNPVMPIYNCATSTIRKVSSRDIIDLGKLTIQEYPFDNMVWAPGGKITEYKLVNFLKVIFFHILPAFVFDNLMSFTGRKPFIVRLQRKIYAANLALLFFVDNTWTFCNDNFLNLSSSINATDMTQFNFDEIQNADLVQFFTMATLGARRYLLKEKDENLPKARRNMRRMIILDKVVKTIVYGSTAYYLFIKYNIIVVIYDLVTDYLYNMFN